MRLFEQAESLQGVSGGRVARNAFVLRILASPLLRLADLALHMGKEDVYAPGAVS